MNNDLLRTIDKLSNDDFLQWARWFNRGNLTLNDYVMIRDKVKKRCHDLGYGFSQGCCGQNNIVKIHVKGTL